VEAILQRDRLVVAGCLVTMVVLSWIYLLDMAADMSQMSMPMTVPQWDVTDLTLLFIMWAVMMVAMMVPSAVPVTLAFLSVNQRRQDSSRPLVPTYIFVLGYIVMWCAYSALATFAQWGLHEATVISPAMRVTSPVITGVLLIAAGVFQWTPFKRSCLLRCRSPLSFLMSRWREGRWGALLMGLEHGSYCVGCCWILMALLFVTGVMNLFWVAVIAAFVLTEKLFPHGELIGRVIGLVLVTMGMISVVRVL
jgi:predicted metal-binding membrane protein